MKYILFLLTIFSTSFVLCSAQTEKLDEFFRNFEKSGKVTSIDIKKPMFSLLKSIDIDDDYIKNIKPILSQVDGVKMLILTKATYPERLKSENIEIEKLNVQKVDRVNAALRKLDFEELMSANNNGSSIRFLAEGEKGGYLENLIFNIDSKEENIIFLLNGKIKKVDVDKMISASNFTFLNPSTSKTETIADISNYLNGETRNVGEFSALHVSTGVKVVYKQESKTSVKVIADADKLGNIITKVENGTLKIYIDNKGKNNLRFKNLSINVSAPHLKNVKALSGAQLTIVDELSMDNFDLETSSGGSVVGKLKIRDALIINASSGSNVKANISSQRISVKNSSGANVELKGSANEGFFDVSSGASLDGVDFRTNNTIIESTSGSSANVNVKDKMKVKASSGGSVRYKGNPEIESNISKVSGGSLKQIN
ncbi:DUF4252 domain-containing protein [Chryseobacterium sp.]|uniref:DUF4252 domain-containing protein n=1 Tax=Chryseobacterium sp. TaxID=1871047 RepID=UPI00388F8ECE